MKNTLIGSLPRHLYAYADTHFTHKRSVGRVPVVWFGLVSYPGRSWGCTVMFENGAVYRNLPPHAISFSKERKCNPAWTIYDAQTWNCYGESFSVLEYPFLAGLACRAKCNGMDHVGEYLFTVSPIGDGYSAYPEQAKEFSFIKLENGELTVQPTNHILFMDNSFTNTPLHLPKCFKRQTKITTCE